MNKVFISCKESRIENNKSFYGCFHLGPFNESESLTIANALRRTLLSECSGLAIISVIIEDVNHEYSTLSGIRDSVLDILLNLKEIVFKKNSWELIRCKVRSLSPAGRVEGVGTKSLSPNTHQPVGADSHCEAAVAATSLASNAEPFIRYNVTNSRSKGPARGSATNSSRNHLEDTTGCIQPIGQVQRPVVGYLKVKGPGIVRAKNLRLPPFIQCVDPEQYIATLSENGYLNMKFVIMEGKGFILQKTNSFVDGLEDATLPKVQKANYIQKRRILLKDLKDLMLKNLCSSPLESVGLCKAKRQKGPVSNSKASWPLQGQGALPIYKNASILNIDAVFSPIKKVNYIIELDENKIVNNLHEKYSFMSYISTLMDCVRSRREEAFNKGLASRTHRAVGLHADRPLSHQNALHYKGAGPLNSPAEKQWTTSTASLPDRRKAELLPTDSKGRGVRNIKEDIKTYVETYTTEEISSTTRTLHPLEKEGVPHTVILEIWTNGSLHPREALSMAFSHLTSLFMNLEKTKVLNPIYKDASSYKKCFNILTLDAEASPTGRLRT